MWCCTEQRWIGSEYIFFRAVAEDNEWEVRVPPPLSLQWPGTPRHRSEWGDLEAGAQQQHRLSVSEASSEGDERNGGNVIRLGEDSVREWAGKRMGCGEARGAPLPCLPVSPCWRQVWDLQLKQRGTAAPRDVPVTLMDEVDALTSVLSAIPDGRNGGQCTASSHSSWPPGTPEIASLCRCPCIYRWLGPSKDESQWKPLSCCGYSCEDRTDLQDHTVERFF